MTALKITLANPLDSFVEEQVRSGAYPDAEAVVRAGLTLLRDDDARTTRYKALLQEGLDELERGEGVEVTDIGAWLNTLGHDAAK